MKHFTFMLFLLLLNLTLLAQSDTSAYNVQRNKINQLLQERSVKFSQYDNSLSKRTGIFGLKTKRDMQASNDILTQIVLNDNNIFSELKILLDYKDFEKKEVQHRAETVEGRIDRFQTTITRLQQENERLKAESEKQGRHDNSMVIYLAASILALLIAVIYALRLKKLRKPDIQSI
ncbi:hypothetical protein [Daejeonella sp.]|uniref:hypothetical protein n=1 Tax=Daejeonella sp. TaxID=2805397 RepID=UPI0030BC4AB2